MEELAAFPAAKDQEDTTTAVGSCHSTAMPFRCCFFSFANSSKLASGRDPAGSEERAGVECLGFCVQFRLPLLNKDVIEIKKVQKRTTKSTRELECLP